MSKEGGKASLIVLFRELDLFQRIRVESLMRVKIDEHFSEGSLFFV